MMKRETLRPISEGMERVMENGSVSVLDHGFVRVVDYVGNDDAVVQAARVSYGEGTKTVSDDRSLIRYLLRKSHTTPFEMCEVKLHCKMPIFVARQWIRHRTASVNEYSARYSVVSDQYYMPEKEQICEQSQTNAQGSGTVIGEADAEQVRELVKGNCDTAHVAYQFMLDMNLSRETARIVLPVNMYTEWYWKIDLHNLLHFLALRTHPHAQWEIRQYAEVMLDMVRQWVPVTYEAFIDYVVNSVTLSAQAAEVVIRLLRGESWESLGHVEMSKREWRELSEFLSDE